MEAMIVRGRKTLIKQLNKPVKTNVKATQVPIRLYLCYNRI